MSGGHWRFESRTTNAAEPQTRMHDALGATSQEIYVTRHAIRISLRQIWQAQRMHAQIASCMHVTLSYTGLGFAPGPARAPARSGLDSTGVEVLCLPPLTLFALEDNQSSASARTHHFILVPTDHDQNFVVVRDMHTRGRLRFVPNYLSSAESCGLVPRTWVVAWFGSSKPSNTLENGPKPVTVLNEHSITWTFSMTRVAQRHRLKN